MKIKPRTVKKNLLNVGNEVEVALGRLDPAFVSSRYTYRISKRDKARVHLVVVTDKQQQGVTECNEKQGPFAYRTLCTHANNVMPLALCPNKPFAVGDRVDVAWRLQPTDPWGWWPATIVSKRGALYKVRYDFVMEGFSATNRVTAGMMRAILM